MRKILSLFFVICLTVVLKKTNGFILDEISMSAETYEACSTCDERSDRAGNRAVAEALRNYMTMNHVKFAVESGDVRVTERFPNQGVSTGHSCSVTGEARNVYLTAEMTNPNDELDSLDIDYEEQFKMSFLSGDVPHKVTFKADIRSSFGTKIFGKCKRYGRKTCSSSATSHGVNKILVTLSASDFQTFSTGNIDFMEFKLGVQVENLMDATAYAPIQVSRGSGCNVLGGFSIDKYVQRGANSYLQSQNNRVNQLRGAKLIQRLEDVLQAKLGTWVTIPVKIHEKQCGDPAGTTITGGSEAYPNMYPWQVLVGDDITGELCCGSLITYNHILTAAHCVFNKTTDDLLVLVGHHNWTAAPPEDFQYLSDISMFPNFTTKDAWKETSDVAILTLDAPMKASPKLQPICLPENMTSSYIDEVATIAGWGVDSHMNATSDVLMEVNVTIIDNLQCKEDYWFIEDYHLCTDPESGKSHCKGDSGGALFLKENGRYVAIGVASFGSKTTCGRDPGGFARITSQVMDWVGGKITDEVHHERRKRQTSDRCQRKVCPPDFHRIGNTQRCQRTFGTSQPDCSQFGTSAKLVTTEIAGGKITVNSCHVDMVLG